MRLNLKAALLSALVIPGLGQLYIGNKLKGGVMIVVVSTTMSGSPDVQKVLETMRNDTPAARWLLAAFFGLWLYGVVDALFSKSR